jgi:hypothetical protein
LPLADHLEAAEQAFLLAALPAHLAAVPLDLLLTLAKVLASTATATSLRAMAARCAHNVLHLLARQHKARVVAARQAAAAGQQLVCGSRHRPWPPLTVCCAPPGVTLVRLLCCPQLLASLLVVTGCKDDVDEELASCCAKMLGERPAPLIELLRGTRAGQVAARCMCGCCAHRCCLCQQPATTP